MPIGGLLMGMGHLKDSLFCEWRPPICRPIGSPSELKPQLTDIAGAPVKLKGLVITGGKLAAISLDVISGSVPWARGAQVLEVGRMSTS
ncbi:MAG: hypothetical protein Ct9H300mP11_06270 [Chloroflexota bacterium]|nr:MAG: hypothetical protein Ct9H300mP11_06270 [Chloroflexota bacterium]